MNKKELLLPGSRKVPTIYGNEVRPGAVATGFLRKTPKAQNLKTKPLATASGSDSIPTTASSESCELKTLPEVGLRKIDLDYRTSRRTDEFGNQFKYKAKVRNAQDAQLGRWAWDVFLVMQH
ncbi:MAG TPA: hypothetical protein VGO50_09610 [Pyrinomonadaceae bacterium]|jgi:hypothetical protein|nr:hypothetical protein [Pyrinomonadaceae bacterium]